MSLIRIKPALKLSDFDQLYKELYFLVEHEGIADLELPRQLSRSFFALTASLIQFVATWIRYEGHGRLLLDPGDNDESIARAYEEEYFFPIVAMAWNDVPLVNYSGKNLRPILRRFQNDFIVKMRKISALKGEKLLLVNLDHFDNDTGILPFFELRNEFVINEDSLADSLRYPILNEVLKYSRSSKAEFEQVFNDVAGIIFELMKNTFEWGRSDEQELPLSPNIRGVFIRFFKKTKAILLEDYRRDQPISSYFGQEGIFEENDLGQIYFIEISVFDSGRGFVNKFKSSDKNALSDIEIIKKCLIKNQTSSQGNLRHKKGIGLDRILQIIDHKGFLRLRTDKYCLYRNMAASPYRPLAVEDFRDVELRDWHNQSDDDFTPLPFSSGSALSILYPLPVTNQPK